LIYNTISYNGSIMFWSTTFNKFVDVIEGVDIPGRRILLKMDNTNKLIECPESWVELINESNESNASN
jgi:hypothetical protein